MHHQKSKRGGEPVLTSHQKKFRERSRNWARTWDGRYVLLGNGLFLCEAWIPGKTGYVRLYPKVFPNAMPPGFDAQGHAIKGFPSGRPSWSKDGSFLTFDFNQKNSLTEADPQLVVMARLKGLL